MNTKAIVTGHSRGLGAGIVRALLASRIPVLGVSRSVDPALADSHPDLLEQLALDLADRSALQAWLGSGELERFVAGARRVLLVNNAGVVTPIGPLATQSPEAVGDAVTLNVAAPLMLAAALERDAAAVPDRRILHVSSGAARNPYPGWAVYCATKAALDHHARCVELDAVPGLKACSLAPGVIDTGMQVEIRATAADRFPMLDRFVSMKRDGALADPGQSGARIVDFLLSDAFGRAAVADLRDFAAGG